MADARRIPLSHVPDRCGLGRAHFFEVLAGRASPTLAWVTKVASVFEVDPSDLLTPSARSGPFPE
jgi:DNA-binding phage protein